MDKYQAEKIINAYGGAIANDENIFKKQSTLPCSKAKIRKAFYIYISSIIEDFRKLPQDIGHNLVTTYSMMDCFLLDENAERLNNLSGLIKNGKLNAENPNDKKQMDEYFSLTRDAIHNGIYFDEINNYIEECYKENGIKQ